MNSVFKVIASPNDKIEEYKNKAMEELNDFFYGETGNKWEQSTPKVLVVYDRDTINLLRQGKTEDWLVGWSWGRDAIIILNPNSFATESLHHYADEEFYKLVKHELTHAFFVRTFGGRSSFLWVEEGVPLCVSNQLETGLAFKHLKGFLDNNDIYSESGTAIKLLLDNFGKEKLFEFLKRQNQTNKQDRLVTIFKKVYNSELNYDFFNSLVNIGK